MRQRYAKGSSSRNSVGPFFDKPPTAPPFKGPPGRVWHQKKELRKKKYPLIPISELALTREAPEAFEVLKGLLKSPLDQLFNRWSDFFAIGTIRKSAQIYLLGGLYRRFKVLLTNLGWS